MMVSDQENRSESALESQVDDTSSEVKLCDRVSDRIWYCVRMICVHRMGLNKANDETFLKEMQNDFECCGWTLLL
jgi:hypothetical protein